MFLLLSFRCSKTGWANQSSTPGVEYVTSDEFPEDSAQRIQNAHLVLTQLTGSGLMAMASIAQLGLTPAVTTNSFNTTTSTSQGTIGAQVSKQQPPAHIASAAEAALNEAFGQPSSSTTTNNASANNENLASSETNVAQFSIYHN